jgi:hypothetical protein
MSAPMGPALTAVSVTTLVTTDATTGMLPSAAALSNAVLRFAAIVFCASPVATPHLMMRPATITTRSPDAVAGPVIVSV